MRNPLVATFALLAVSCASPTAHRTQLRITPEQAVINAAQSDGGITGLFELVVLGTGRQNGRLFLNSQADYRDPRNLTIAITPEVERALEDRLGSPLIQAVHNKTIAVRGTARTTKIWLMTHGRRTEKYYFQTHVNLQRSSDLTVSGEHSFR